MKQYHDLLQHILSNGQGKDDRTGTGTISTFGYQMRFNLNEGFPLVTTKKVFLKAIIHELLWFLSGDTNIKYLNDNGVRIWDEWSDERGNLGMVYGSQWVRWENSDWERDVTLIKQRLEAIDAPYAHSQHTLSPVHNDHADDYIGQTFTNKCGDEFVVIERIPNGKNSKYVVQFKHTSGVIECTRPSIRAGNLKDPYKITTFGQGCIGVPDRNHPKYKTAYNLWYNMMARCYNPSLPKYNEYGGAGVFVDQRWRCFENFLDDIVKLPFYSKWVVNPSEYHLDKDYYASNGYSAYNCIFLPKRYNLALKNLTGYMYTAKSKNDPSIDDIQFTSQHWFAKRVGLRGQIVNTAINRSPTKSCRDWQFTITEPPNGHVYRHRMFINQIENVVEQIKNNPHSRRLIVSGWNTSQVGQMALPPCHTLFQFYVDQEKRLSCQLYQRSADVFLGVPFNIASYALLTQMVAHVCGLKLGDFVHTLGDVHIYKNHIDQVEKQLTREPFPLPQMKIQHDRDSIFDFKYEDFKLLNYRAHPTISAPIAV